MDTNQVNENELYGVPIQTFAFQSMPSFLLKNDSRTGFYASHTQGFTPPPPLSFFLNYRTNSGYTLKLRMDDNYHFQFL